MVVMYAGSHSDFEIAQWQCSTGFHEKNQHPALLVVIPEEARALGIRDFSVSMSSCCVCVLQLLKHTREALPQCLLSPVQSFEQDLMLG